jgi:competence protein ComEA
VTRLLAMGCLLGQIGVVLALDLNTATEAELDGLSGVGPAFTARVMQARAERPFQDWADFIRRVKGVQERTAWRLSQQGARIRQAPLTAPHTAPLSPPHARVSRD